MSLLEGLSKLQNLLNIRYERLGPGRMRAWVVEPAGLRIRHNGAEVASLPWDGLAEIVTFKRDYGATDQVCLGFRPEGLSDYLVLEEDNPAWQEVLAACAAHWPLPDGWLEQVTEPPFACNWTTLWGEPPSEARRSG